MDDIKNMLLGVDTTNEIFNLWYEVTFLRMILSNMVSHSLYLQEVMTPELIDECRKQSQDIVQARFPVCKISFSPPSEDQLEKRTEHLKSLKKFNDLVNGWRDKPISNQTEDPSCTPQDPLGVDSSSPRLGSEP